MKVTTHISKMDLIRFNLAILPKSRSTYVRILVIALLAFWFICWKSGVPHTANNWMAALIGSLGGGFFGMLFGVALSMISILGMSSSKNGILGEHEYTLTSDGLHEKTSVNEGLSKWKGITEIRVVGPYLLFQISSYAFHIVPARSFESKESFTEYVRSSMGYWHDAHDKHVN
jgi:hypothetical protein